MDTYNNQESRFRMINSTISFRLWIENKKINPFLFLLKSKKLWQNHFSDIKKLEAMNLKEMEMIIDKNSTQKKGKESELCILKKLKQESIVNLYGVSDENFLKSDGKINDIFAANYKSINALNSTNNKKDILENLILSNLFSSSTYISKPKDFKDLLEYVDNLFKDYETIQVWNNYYKQSMKGSNKSGMFYFYNLKNINRVI